MSQVFFDVGVSLDGFIAGPNRGPRNPSETEEARSTSGCSSRSGSGRASGSVREARLGPKDG